MKHHGDLWGDRVAVIPSGFCTGPARCGIWEGDIRSRAGHRDLGDIRSRASHQDLGDIRSRAGHQGLVGNISSESVNGPVCTTTPKQTARSHLLAEAALGGLLHIFGRFCIDCPPELEFNQKQQGPWAGPADCCRMGAAGADAHAHR